MKKIKLITLLAILMVVSATSGCNKEDVNLVSVTLASWYFGTWIENGSGELLQISESSVLFSPSSNLQFYGSLKWYDAGDDSADVFFGHNTAGGSFQGTEGFNTVPNFYHINHEGESLSIRSLDMSTQSEKVVATYTRESSDLPEDANSFIGLFQADWNCFNYQHSDDPGLTAYEFLHDGTFRYITGMYDVNQNTTSNCPDVNYAVWNTTGLHGTWTSAADEITLEGSVNGIFIMVDGNLKPKGYPVYNSCDEEAVYYKVSSCIGFTWGSCNSIDW